MSVCQYKHPKLITHFGGRAKSQLEYDGSRPMPCTGLWIKIACKMEHCKYQIVWLYIKYNYNFWVAGEDENKSTKLSKGVLKYVNVNE